LVGQGGDELPGVPVGPDVVHSLLAKPRRQVDRDIGTVAERGSDSPELVEVLVAEDQALDLAAHQHRVDALFGEPLLHPRRTHPVSNSTLMHLP